MPSVRRQRLAVAADIEQIAALMRASVLEIFPRFYEPERAASAALGARLRRERGLPRRRGVASVAPRDGRLTGAVIVA